MEENNNTPQLLEVVDRIRACSFKPEDHFIPIIKFNDNGDESFYLEVKWRMFWFQTYCAENKINGSIEEKPATLIAGTNFIQVEALVKMDGNVVGSGIGGFYLSGSDISCAVQQAATIAKGRALANAGFGTVFTSAAASEAGGREIPCDAGLKTSEFFVRRPNNPMMVGNADSPAENAEKKAEPVAAPEKKPMTREEAFKVKVEIKGSKFNGEAIGDLIGKNPNAVKYLANNKSYAGTEFQRAARIALGLDKE